MALFKEIMSANGVTTKYHKIKNLSMTKVAERKKDSEPVEKYVVEAVVFSYVDESFRQASENYIVGRKTVNVTCSLEEGNTTPIHELVYGKLKETECFKDAVDC